MLANNIIFRLHPKTPGFSSTKTQVNMFASKVLRQAAAHAERTPSIRFIGKRTVPCMCAFSGWCWGLAGVSGMGITDTIIAQLPLTTHLTLTPPRRLARSPRDLPRRTRRSARTAITPSSLDPSARPSSQAAAVSAAWPVPISDRSHPPRATTSTVTTFPPASTALPLPPRRSRPLRLAGLRLLPR